MIADFSTRISKTLLLILISHQLGVTQMGAFSLALTYLGFGILFSNWGFGNLLTREVARDKNVYNKYLTNYGVLRIAFAGIAILFINILLPYLGYSNETTLVIRIISFSLLATTLVRLFYSLFIAFEQLKYISIISFIFSILRLVASLIVLLLGGTIIHISIIYSASEFISLLFSILMISRVINDLKFEFDHTFALSQITKAFPFFWIGVMVMLDTRSEVIVLSLFFNEAMVGYYTAANTVLGGVTLFSEAIRNAIFPMLTRYQLESPSKLQEVTFLVAKYVLLITIPISIIVFFFSQEIIFFFFDNTYETSIQLLQITIWSFISYSLTVILIGTLMAHDEEKKVALTQFVSGAVTLILDIILIPTMGINAIAYVRLFTSILTMALCLYFHYQTTHFGFIKPDIAFRTLLGGSMMFVISILLIRYNQWIGVLVGLMFYILTLFVTKVLQSADVTLWKKVFREFFTKSVSNANE